MILYLLNIILKKLFLTYYYVIDDTLTITHNYLFKIIYFQ